MVLFLLEGSLLYTVNIAAALLFCAAKESLTRLNCDAGEDTTVFVHPRQCVCVCLQEWERVCRSRSATPPTPHTVTPLALERLHNKMDPTAEKDSGAQGQHPWPHLKELFELFGAKNNSWRPPFRSQTYQKIHCVMWKPSHIKCTIHMHYLYGEVH